MRIDVVSDIHGNFDALARVAAQSETLIVLGDLLDYVDYSDPAAGILGTLFGGDAVARLIQFRTVGDFDSYHQLDRELWTTLSNPYEALDEVVAEQYTQAIACLGDNVFLTLGNVDVEHVWTRLAPDHLRYLDGEVVEIDGVRLGFVAGGAVRVPPTGSPWKSFDRTYEAFTAAGDQLGDFDVLCSHIPPKLPELRFDTVTQREEMYGPCLLELIDSRQPRMALFGHIHHPARNELLRGRTRCVNVGYFKHHPTSFTIDTDELRG